MPDLPPLPPVPSWLWLLALALLALAWWLAATRTRRGNARRGRLARAAEDDAEHLLAALGFAVEDRQVTAVFDVSVDGTPVEVWCRADLLVRRRRHRYVAEVKSGGAADPTCPAVRRQLLEYRLAFPVDGVLLVDPARRSVVEVAFPLLAHARR